MISKTSNIDDFRRFERYNVSVPARIELLRSRRKHRIVEAHISDVSATGGFVKALKGLPVGQAIKAEIFFLFESSDPACEAGHELITMNVTGSVVRSGKSGTALNFNENFRFTSSRIADEKAGPEEGGQSGPFGGKEPESPVKILMRRSTGESKDSGGG